MSYYEVDLQFADNKIDKYACRISVKTRTCFHGFTYVFLGIHVRVFRKTCTNKKQVWKNRQ